MLGAFCGSYEEQTRFAFHLIADHKANDYLWGGWDSVAGGVESSFDFVLP
ncbi:hypothetical protein GPA27_26445 [Aromatoleum toluolicum]|uniref:Uncharacterized protein n=1 Tax=Aromatoleum toluolicum TaxID=90060 RepID=A0ABX1NNR0_9RHOO|nr:hypothetical protein [Aromatoleum toluolicum]NMG00921.1 hypothetical protein [Aromatoleum toluolicum]